MKISEIISKDGYYMAEGKWGIAYKVSHGLLFKMTYYISYLNKEGYTKEAMSVTPMVSIDLFNYNFIPVKYINQLFNQSKPIFIRAESPIVF